MGMGIVHSVLSTFSRDLAIDLGTANTLIYLRGEGVVCDEPSMIAVRHASTGSRQILAVGEEAKRMWGRSPSSIVVSRPIRDGAIADFETVEDMLRYFIQKVCNRRLLRPQVLICVPSGLTAVEKRAVVESAESLGARRVYLVEQAMAAAIGAGLPVSEPVGSMIIDIGGGTTDIAVISLGGLVWSNSLRTAGDKIDEAIIGLVKQSYNMQIGERTAELVKVMLGSVSPDPEIETIQIKGRDLSTKQPKTVEVNDEEIRQAIMGPVYQLLDAVREGLEHTPPELISDIAERGIVLAGGGALLRNLDAFMLQEIGLPTRVASDPLKAVVRGAGELLDNPSLLHQVLLH
jgi:rod shape-determining protein MreB and related proteins